MKKNSFFPAALLFLLIGTNLILHYHHILLSPNRQLFGNHDDALKNYFTPCYHVMHDSSYFWFDGMNFPYGEHVVFTDCQPLLSNTLKWVSRNVVDISGNVVGIMNLFMLLSLFLTGWLLFLIFRRFQVGPYFAAFAAAGITCLSPQLLKTGGHFALSYTFFVPLIWFLLLRFREKPGIIRSLTLALAVFLMAWLHPYYLMISGIFLSAFWAFDLIVFRKKYKLRYVFLHLGLQVVLPLLLFFIILKLSDPVSDRPPNPSGHDAYYATWRTVFLPYPIPELTWVRKQFQTPQEASWEGVAYIGIAGGLLFLFFLTRTARRFQKNTRRYINRRRLQTEKTGSRSIIQVFRRLMKPSQQEALTISVLAGIAVLIFSMGFPFALNPEKWTDIFPPIKQFRTLGRFAWVFYYTWTVFGFYLLWLVQRKLQRKGKRFLAIALPGIFFLTFLLEGWSYNNLVKKRISHPEKSAFLDSQGEMKQNEWLKKIKPGEYSALLVLPYFHIGSENFIVFDSEASGLAMTASYRSGLPLLNVMMSRTSFEQSWKHIQLVTEPYRPLEILKDLQGDKPVLVMQVTDHSGKKGMAEGKLRATSLTHGKTPLFKNKQVEFYSLDRASLENHHHKRPWDFPGFLPDTLFARGNGLFSNSDSGYFSTRTFDTLFTGKHYIGDGSFRAVSGGHNILFDEPVPVGEGDTLLISLWMRMRKDLLPLTVLGLEENNQEGKGLELWDYRGVNRSILAMDGEWALVQREMVLKKSGNRVIVNIKRKAKMPQWFEIDELLIRKKGVDVWAIRGGMLFCNNYVWKPEIEIYPERLKKLMKIMNNSGPGF